MRTDSDLAALLELDGQRLFIHEAGYWVLFDVKQVPPSTERPHGLDYSLTLHAPDGTRIVGFDNAHPVSTASGPARRSRMSQDHRHVYRSIKPYEYTDAARLVADFWEAVEKIMKELALW